MNAFDYLFSFYGLLLGIAVANVAIGFADMWRDCEKIQVGGCPPLLCGIVLLGGMNVWLTMWHIRANVDVTAWQMVAAACVALPYVFISRAMFPGQERQQERSLEEHYLRHRILILTILMIPPLASAISKVVLDRTQDYGLKEVWLGTRLVMPLILMPLKTRTGQRVRARSLPRSRVCRAVSLREEEALPGLREEEGRASERFASWAQRPPELAKGRRRCVRLGLPLPR